MTPASACRHCGLPAGGAEFCCYGCELASELRAEAARGHSSLKARLVVSVLLGMTVMMLSLFLYAEDVYGAAGGLGWLRSFYRWTALVLTAPVVVLLGWPLVRGAVRFGMERLVAIAAAAAYGLSVWGAIADRPLVYVDSAAAALVLASLGRYLEATARARASGVLGRLVDLGGRGAAAIQPGDAVRVPVEQVVPVDVEVRGAPVEVDLGVVTGEPRPVLVAVGEAVPAGAVPLSSRSGRPPRARPVVLSRPSEHPRRRPCPRWAHTCDRLGMWASNSTTCRPGLHSTYRRSFRWVRTD